GAGEGTDRHYHPFFPVGEGEAPSPVGSVARISEAHPGSSWAGPWRAPDATFGLIRATHLLVSTRSVARARGATVTTIPLQGERGEAPSPVGSVARISEAHPGSPRAGPWRVPDAAFGLIRATHLLMSTRSVARARGATVTTIPLQGERGEAPSPVGPVARISERHPGSQRAGPWRVPEAAFGLIRATHLLVSTRSVARASGATVTTIPLQGERGEAPSPGGPV